MQGIALKTAKKIKRAGANLLCNYSVKNSSFEPLKPLSCRYLFQPSELVGMFTFQSRGDEQSDCQRRFMDLLVFGLLYRSQVKL